MPSIYLSVTSFKEFPDSSSFLCCAALVFGKSAASSFHTVRMDSLSVEWSDSDSSVDSMPSSANEDDEQEDWPEHTGFQVCTYVDP